MVASAARPTAPPTWRMVFTSLDARLASRLVHAGGRDQGHGDEDEAHADADADADQNQRPQNVLRVGGPGAAAEVGAR